ncbi:MAG: acyl-CoA dehydrogenase family protein [Acidimicrobiales bacterium]
MADTATQAAIRRDVRAWLDANWDPERSLAEWRPLLVDSGWGCPTWPVEWYGKGLSNTDAAVVTEEMRRAGAAGVAAGGGMSLAAATLLAHGSDELKAAHLRPILTGEHHWCQLFSEPGSGSDLAGLTTRAVLDGEEWIVNGQKVWNTGAHKADFGILLARTNWDVPKHRGITYFVIDMHQPGVEVRPLRQMNGHASFNEVFLTDARVPADAVVGEPELGWAVAITTLMHERNLTAPRGRGGPRKAPEGRTRIEAAAEAAAYNATYSWYPQRAGRADLVTPRAEATGRIADPLVRQDMAALTAFRRATRWTAERARAARASGRAPGPEGSLGKLSSSVVARRCNAVHTAIAGAEGMLTGPDTAAAGMIAEVLISTPAQSIAGGTDEIQKNILGERMLGLPKEPSVDNDVPFHEVRVNTSTRRPG